MMVKTKAEKKNKKNNFKIIAIIVLIPVASILIGFLLTQYFIRPYIVKMSGNLYSDKYTLELPALNFYQLKTGEYKDENDARYNLSLIAMKGMFADVTKTGDKYIVFVGNFLNEENAGDIAKRLDESGIKCSLSLIKGPLYKIDYQKGQKQDISNLKKYLYDFNCNFEALSAISYKIAIGNPEKIEINTLETNIEKSLKAIKKQNNNNNTDKIIDGLESIENNMLEDLKKLMFSIDLNDGNAYGISQKALWNAMEKYNNMVNSIRYNR
ncbi:SPOR domain-containing protein [Aceticella autotrophica]|uniref:SPOR domain-containing protein n=1 Tax=Aceticella autotrophica TaxID=2755338 RepID=A0A975AWW2_9THEO|nr:SPOR domain-containing protein [Aceticella autotrophica]QSZ27868.1 SPOR domain-containing protein [Aceticella autotrophica]